MTRQIRPRRVDWPSLFWSRADGSWMDNDLLCRACQGSGCRLSRDDIDEDTGPKDVACLACRGSSLLVPAREVSDHIAVMLAADEAGGGWMDRIGHTVQGILWPAPWAWRISRKRFAIRRDVYAGGGDVLAFMHCGSVVVGLYKLDEGRRGRLEAVFRHACGKEAEVPMFVMPRRTT